MAGASSSLEDAGTKVQDLASQQWPVGLTHAQLTGTGLVSEGGRGALL